MIAAIDTRPLTGRRVLLAMCCLLVAGALLVVGVWLPGAISAPGGRALKWLKVKQSRYREGEHGWEPKR